MGRPAHTTEKHGPQPALSAASRGALSLLAETIKAARLERRMPQEELASRLGVSRYTVMAIERGDARVAVGTVFEAAAVLGIPLLGGDGRGAAAEAHATRALLRHLPSRGRRQAVRLNDDF